MESQPFHPWAWNQSSASLCQSLLVTKARRNLLSMIWANFLVLACVHLCRQIGNLTTVLIRCITKPQFLIYKAYEDWCCPLCLFYKIAVIFGSIHAKWVIEMGFLFSLRESVDIFLLKTVVCLQLVLFFVPCEHK